MASVAPSALSDVITIVSSSKVPSKVSQKPVAEEPASGGLVDYDEINGVEREAAVTSPKKGKKRVTSTVRFNAFI